MKNYNDLLRQLVGGQNITFVPSRAGKVCKLNHAMLSYDLREGFPAITGRKLQFTPMAAELACFVKGLTEIEEFKKRGCNIWDANLADFNARNNTPSNTNLGPVYGAQWRNFNGLDQLSDVLYRLKQDRFDRRLIVTAWNPLHLPAMALPPCHLLWQVGTEDGEHLDLCFYMRSVDLALGFPFDIASYALLLHLICVEVDMQPGKLTAFLADAHVYFNNLAGVLDYLDRPDYALPTLQLDMEPGQAVSSFEPSMAQLLNYRHGDPIKMEMQV